MTNARNSGQQRHLEWLLPGATRDSWLVPSALLSARWSQDNPLTPDPSLLYTGAISARVGLDELQVLLEKFGESRPDVEVTGGGLGVLTWNVIYQRGQDSSLLALPLCQDSIGALCRQRSKVPERAFENARGYISRGLDRYLLPPLELVPLGSGLVGATFSVPSCHHPLSYCQGRVRVDLQDAEGGWVLPLGHEASADVLTELVAALVYHYDPEEEGGTALSDVFINDGDFLVRRAANGAFQLRLTVARFRQTGIPPNRYLLHLMQLVAYEDWAIGEKLRGLPVLMSHPSIALRGVTRGLRLRSTDLGLGAHHGSQAAVRWVTDFARSPEGRGYRPWIERYLAGELPPSLDSDPRTSWWNLTELRQQRNFAQLKRRWVPTESIAAEAAQLSAAVELLSRQLRRSRTRDPQARIFVNDLNPEEVRSLSMDSMDGDGGLVHEWFQRWPFRRAEELPAALHSALSSETSSRLDFRKPLAAEADSDLQSLDEPKENSQPDSSRVPLANPEVFEPVAFSKALHASAVHSFPSFESYMDDALHHPDFGYYQRRVSIGRAGDFSTHPEDLSPQYGGWVASLIGQLYAEMLEHGAVTATDAFAIVEFGAGTGRLARDIIDSINSRADGDALESQADSSLWKQLQSNFRYHVYELSDSLRAEQRALLGSDAEVSPGDAGTPDACLKRDFPDGVRGIILSNELPDAFGVHKVVLSSQGEAHAVVVVPRIEARALARFTAELRDEVAAVDIRLRRTFGWTRHPEDRFLDHGVWRNLMSATYEQQAGTRDLLLDGIWFEEGLVEAQAFEKLGLSLRRDSTELARALTEGDSGVVVYVNLHAETFIQKIAENLRSGFSLTIDYGDCTQGLIEAARQRMFPLRVYRSEGQFVPRPNDPYARPGTQDLTADVNFTSLARAGLDAGLALVHFGLERDIAHADFPKLLRAEKGSTIERFLGNPAFRLLALGTEPLASKSKTFERHFEPLPLLAPPAQDADSPSGRTAAIDARLKGG